MSFIEGQNADQFLSILQGDIKGESILSAFGERINVGTTTTGEDIWTGVATEIPIPSDSGEIMLVTSSSASDTTAGTGARTVKIGYLKADGLEDSETITMNGVTPVAMTNTAIRYIQEMSVITNGSNNAAVGRITIYQSGNTSEVYNEIIAGSDQSLRCARMVPSNCTYFLSKWSATEANARRQSIRIRTTSDSDVILKPGVFNARDSLWLNNTPSPEISLYYEIPPLAIVKVTSYAIVVGGEVSARFTGVLRQN